MKTKTAIEYVSVPQGYVATIPAGTEVVEATNVPSHDGQKRYWAEPWVGMSEEAESWARTYGFLLDASEVG